MARSDDSPIIVALPREAARLAKGIGRDREWCYLGSSIRRRERVSAVLNSERRVSVAREIDLIAGRCKQPFLDWLESVGRLQRDRLGWWTSTLASRSSLQTDLFLQFCYAELIRSWIAERRGPVVVVVEDPWLILFLKRRFPDESGLVFFGGLPMGLCTNTLYWLARAPLSVAHTLAYALAAFMLGGLIRRREPREGGASVLIHTWIDGRSVSQRGVFQDPYTGRLESFFTSRGQTVLRLTHWHIPPTLIPRLKSFWQDFLLAPHYLRLSDILHAVTSRFTLSNLDSIPRMLGWDMRPLLRREMLHEWGHPAYSRYRLTYLCLRRMASQWASQVKCIVYPFENLPWEKMLCLAWREASPTVRLVGYQHSSVPPLLLNYFLGQRESEIMPLPDQVIANSSYNEALLRSGGYPSVLNGGALRYEHLFLDLSAAEGRKISSDADRFVLVVFPTCVPYAEALFFDVMETFKDPLHVPGAQRPVPIVLKFHPVLPFKIVAPANARLPRWVSVSEQSLDQLLPKAGVLLYVPHTTSWWEAFIAGVPVLKYQTDMLDVDSSSALDGDAPRICRRETIRDEIASALSRGKTGKCPEHQLEKFFGRVNENLWLQMTGELR